MSKTKVSLTNHSGRTIRFSIEKSRQTDDSFVNVFLNGAKHRLGLIRSWEPTVCVSTKSALREYRDNPKAGDQLRVIINKYLAKEHSAFASIEIK